MAKGKVCLAYSGGLDTSCILRYLLVSRVLNKAPAPLSKCECSLPLYR